MHLLQHYYVFTLTMLNVEYLLSADRSNNEGPTNYGTGRKNQLPVRHAYLQTIPRPRYW